jgi:hypothetical protein
MLRSCFDVFPRSPLLPASLARGGPLATFPASLGAPEQLPSGAVHNFSVVPSEVFVDVQSSPGEQSELDEHLAAQNAPPPNSAHSSRAVQSSDATHAPHVIVEPAVSVAPPHALSVAVKKKKHTIGASRLRIAGLLAARRLLQERDAYVNS